MKKVFIKVLVFMLISVLSLSLLAGCQDDGEEKGTVKLTVWSAAPLFPDWKNTLKVNPTDKQSLFTKAVLEKFEADNPGVKVNLLNKGWGDVLNQNLVQALGANTAGDVVVGEQYIRAFIEEDIFEELTLSKEVQDDLIPQVKSTITYNDKIYAAPVWTGSFALTINTKVLREAKVVNDELVPDSKYTSAGINPLAPATWEDLLVVCEDIKKYYASQSIQDKGAILLSKTAQGSSWRALAYMRTAGGEFVDENGKIDLNTPENIKAFNLMRSLNGTSPSGSIGSANEDMVWSYFFNNKAAYIVDGIDTVTRAPRYNLEIGKDVIPVALPTFKENGVKSNVLVGTGYYSVIKTSKNKQLGQKFIDFLLSPWVQNKLISADMRVPVRKSVLESEETTSLEIFKYMQPYLQPFTDSNYLFNGGIPSFKNNASHIWEKWDSFTNKLFSTTEDLSQLVENAHNQMTEAQNRT